MLTEAFDEAFRSWVAAFCQSLNYPFPQNDWFDRINDRLPRGLRETIALGIRENTIKSVKGYKVSLAGLRAGKSYSWFGKSAIPGDDVQDHVDPVIVGGLDGVAELLARPEMRK